jgi:hypothetical protein
LYESVSDVLNCDTRNPTQLRPPLAVHPGSAGLPSGLLDDGLVLVTSKPVCEYESPNEMRYLSAHGSVVAVAEAELDVVLVDVLSVVDDILEVLVDDVLVELELVEDVLLVLVLDVLVELLVLDTLVEVLVLVALVEVLVVVGAGRHWSAVL